MAEKFVKDVTSIRDIGYSGVIKHIFADCLKKKIGLPVIVEPQPANLSEPHLRIMFIGFEFDEIHDVTGYDVEMLYTLKLHCLLTLLAYGDGPDSFLDSVIKVSFALQRLFSQPFTINTIAGYGITVEGKKRPGGQFFKNEEEGKKPYLFEESYDVNLYMPYVEVKNE